MSSLLDDETLMKVDAIHDTALVEKYGEKKGAVPAVQVFFVQPYSIGTAEDKAILVYDAMNGGADAEDGMEVDVLTDTEGHKERMKIYEWVGDGRRTLRFNAWRQGFGKNNPVGYIKFDERPTLSPGDTFVGSVAVNSGRKLPTPGTMATQVNLDVTWAFSGGKAGRDLTHGCYFNGDGVPPRTWEYNDAPEEERFARAMPFETQLLPRIFNDDGSFCSEGLHVSTKFTPKYAQDNAKPPRHSSDVYRPVEAARSLVRLPVNRYPRTDFKTQTAFATPFLLPDEVMMQGHGVTTGAYVGVSKCNDALLVAKGQDAKSRWAIEEVLTLDIKQVREAGKSERYTIINQTIYGERFLQAMGIQHAPLLSAIMRNPIKPIAYDVIFQPSVISAQSKPQNQDPELEARMVCSLPSVFSLISRKRQRIRTARLWARSRRSTASCRTLRARAT